MRWFIGCLLLFFASVCFGKPTVKISTSDINGDGEIESISEITDTATMGLEVSKGGKNLFARYYLPVENSGFKIEDLDLNFGGKEICAFLPSWKQDTTVSAGQLKYQVEVSRWNQKEKRYTLYWVYETHKPYKVGDFDNILVQMNADINRFYDSMIPVWKFRQLIADNKWDGVEKQIGKTAGFDTTIAKIMLNRAAFVCMPDSKDWRMFSSDSSPEVIFYSFETSGETYTVAVIPDKDGTKFAFKIGGPN
ncbi:MAG: hypothetical protein NTW50_02100 [Candidatus Berkelbacteria bacterium]|nr:hypothetical protein [Candidatus Berkelbacteria bacterium]